MAIGICLPLLDTGVVSSSLSRHDGRPISKKTAERATAVIICRASDNDGV